MPVSSRTGFFRKSAAACLFTRELDHCVEKWSKNPGLGPSPNVNGEWRRISPLLSLAARTANSATNWWQQSTRHAGSSPHLAGKRGPATSIQTLRRERARPRKVSKYEKRPDTRCVSSGDAIVWHFMIFTRIFSFINELSLYCCCLFHECDEFFPLILLYADLARSFVRRPSITLCVVTENIIIFNGFWRREAPSPHLTYLWSSSSCLWCLVVDADFFFFFFALELFVFFFCRVCACAAVWWWFSIPIRFPIFFQHHYKTWKPTKYFDDCLEITYVPK